MSRSVFIDRRKVCEFCTGSIDLVAGHIAVQGFTDEFDVCSWSCLASEAKKRGKAQRVADREAVLSGASE